MNSDGFALVWVALGSSRAPTLIDYASQALLRLPGAKAYLITDCPEMWVNSFPGLVIPYSPKDRSPIIKWVERHHPEKVLRNSGFWIKTLERLFALEGVLEWVDENQPIIHLESDVFPLLSRAQLVALTNRCDLIAFPRTSFNSGCASIVFARDSDVLRRGIQAFESIYKREGRWLTDMDLLSLALRDGVAHELPSQPDDAWVYSCMDHEPACKLKLVFDATAFGMYLFGLDPVHTGGVVQSGIEHEAFQGSLKEYRWSILPECHPRASGDSILAIGASDEEPTALANIHVHAKVRLGPFGNESSEWSRALA